MQSVIGLDLRVGDDALRCWRVTWGIRVDQPKGTVIEDVDSRPDVPSSVRDRNSPCGVRQKGLGFGSFGASGEARHMTDSNSRTWVVVERGVAGQVAWRSRRLTGHEADLLVSELRAQGRDAVAKRFRFPGDGTNTRRRALNRRG